jgi:hypothetical protein
MAEGDSFGEVALYGEDATRTATVMASNYCDLDVLYKSEFSRLLAEYPEVDEKIKESISEKASNFKAKISDKRLTQVLRSSAVHDFNLSPKSLRKNAGLKIDEPSPVKNPKLILLSSLSTRSKSLTGGRVLGKLGARNRAEVVQKDQKLQAEELHPSDMGSKSPPEPIEKREYSEEKRRRNSIVFLAHHGLSPKLIESAKDNCAFLTQAAPSPQSLSRLEVDPSVLTNVISVKKKLSVKLQNMQLRLQREIVSAI